MVPSGCFHDLWSLLQEIMGKTVCFTGGLWIFPQPVNFPAKNLKITWERGKRRDMEKRLEERENHVNKRENVEKIKGGVFTKKKNFFFFFSISISCFAYRLKFFFSLYITNFLLLEVDVRLWIIGSILYIWCFVNVLYLSALFMVLSFIYEQFHNGESGDCLQL